jgi:hypothetical protein
VLKANPEKYNLNQQQFLGYLANCSYDKLVSELERLCEMLINKQVTYLSIS